MICSVAWEKITYNNQLEELADITHHIAHNGNIIDPKELDKVLKENRPEEEEQRGKMTVERKNTLIRDQLHEMWAEGTSEVMPTHTDIKLLLISLGWHAENIQVFYDSFQRFYRCQCDIK